MEANVSLSAEFPNDNVALHRGTVWVCLATTGDCEGERQSEIVREYVNEKQEPVHVHVQPPPEEEVEIVVEELDEIEAQLEGPTPIFETIPPPPEEVFTAAPITTSELPPPSNDPFVVFVSALSDVAIGAGSPYVASLLPGLLFDGRVPAPLEADIADALRGAGLLVGNEIEPSFVATANAWRAILRGTSDDFDACGAAMLDEWASDLLARLLAEPTKAQTLRQELRSRGVAAFGLAA